ncbi:Nucleolar GTP-binding protein 1 [Mitosporidium daphniae]|uniref:Nucleolar GTP-binding protein 1 n=1 Tax=Mitosporidium daphniae TaxID=1485682 RepID=A0A098VTJ3_9MICR|nr:nucleolar GTP-binding protein 1 [Mitosporidium daphniae]KGG52154.1 nucleolar GTP-binding protein 1 [Mitosporidium daphniae]|eukprot:XP_013238649.1 nucleolar GTP-binding protein 1 [Mitosporidium daphniae]
MTVPVLPSGPSTSVLTDNITGANHNFKRIQVVPSSTDFLDIVLSKTQRKTPTVVHKGYQISRIRSFYMRKVKYTQSTFEERLQQITTEFPKIEEVHPFYGDLMNVLYDRDHYKLALGQVATARHLVEQISKEYLKLLKFGDSLYRCKQLKRAALGRMATVMRRQRDALTYLEQVRQHLARLPSIDPASRTLLICGFPNVGKSSFMNKVSRAMVDVQPYAFTTKSLFVGHFDYEYARWQVIDTPGILDHALDERNTIEMQSITALAHIRATVLFFMDLSERCGYTIEQQLSLFKSLQPLFRSRPVVLVVSKCDLVRVSDLSPEVAAQLKAATGSVPIVECSQMTSEGVMAVRNVACDLLLAQRNVQGAEGGITSSANGILARLHVAKPVARDNINRPPLLPQGIVVPSTEPLLREIELANGGPGIFSYPASMHHLKADWKERPIPEILNGKNIADFIDADIEAQLEALEAEEEQHEMMTADDRSARVERRNRVHAIRAVRRHETERRTLTRLDSRSRKSNANRPRPRTRISALGTEASAIERPISAKRSASISSSRSLSMHPMSERSRSRVQGREMKGHSTEKGHATSSSLVSLSQRHRNRMGRAGDADRHATASIPKHLFAGKRRNGTHDRR